MMHKMPRDVGCPGRLLTGVESWGDLRGNRRVGLPGGRVARTVLILHTDASSAFPAALVRLGASVGIASDASWEGKLGG